ncbi:hypothetical protein [Pseudooceanicola pacificus]|uniref:hypothetical protein n=1 Tax=Pseudooceanicola pacificus TaxID=2676438 RepID=UPI001365A572|nr:hypothetical protein [Pseudooceanicola pacificus]
MKTSIETVQKSIDQLARRVMGRDAGPRVLRKFRLFLGVVGIIAANVWLGAVIGHGIAAILGVGIFFVVALGGDDALKDGEK